MEPRRLFIAAVLSLLILVVWQWLFPPPEPVARPPLPAAIDSGAVDPGGSAAGGSPDGAQESVAGEPTSGEDGTGASAPIVDRPLIVATGEQSVVIETERYAAELSNRGGVLRSFRLKDHRREAGRPVDLVRARDAGALFPFEIVDEEGSGSPLSGVLHTVERPAADAVTFRYSGPEGAVSKTFRFEDDLFSFDVEVEGLDSWFLLVGPGLRNPQYAELDDRFQRAFRRVSFGAAGEVEDREITDVDGPWQVPSQGTRWFALEDKYFLTSVIPASPVRGAWALPGMVAELDGRAAGFERLPAELSDEDEDRPRDAMLLLGASGDELSGTAYFGAKEYYELRRVAKASGVPPTIADSVRFGVFGFISKPLLLGLRWLHSNVVANYGWCIVLMTVLIKIVLFPLTHRSYVSMQKMQKLSPQMEGIRARYRPKLRDKQGRPNLDMQRKMNEEMQGLFRSEGVSPAGGCLPMLLQMPVFFGFYQLLQNAVELWHEPWILWIHDLTAKDPYYVLPLVMGATQILYSRSMPPATNPSQRMMMKMMPIVFTVFALGFPAGLVLYWLTNNVLTFVQQTGYNQLKKAGVLGGGGDGDDAKGRREASPRRAR